MSKSRSEQIAHHIQRDYNNIMPLNSVSTFTDSAYMLINTSSSGSQKILLKNMLSPLTLQVTALEELLTERLEELDKVKADKCFVMAMSIVF